ncbi:MAG: DUF5615 family PIN-like protein [Planctomycetes bacterium]|nr:DUF5615 family PIN-like protein [Planctomycetota bacterium]
MSAIKFFTDEDVYGAIAVALRRAGFDAISTSEARRLGTSDADQLDWATNEGRVLVTFNVADFAQLHADWLARGQHHAGIAVSSQRHIGDLARRLLHFGNTVAAEAMIDRLEFLGDW